MRRRRKISLYLMDDDFTSFEHVISVLTSLLPRCNALRAESIANIVHTNGIYEIYTSKTPEIFVLHAQMKKAGLKVKLER